MGRMRIGKKFNFSKSSFIIFHLALGVFNFVLFYIICNGYSFVMAFLRRESGVTVFTFDNFKFFFENLKGGAILNEAFGNTFGWFFFSLIYQFVGFFVSYFLYKRIFGFKVFRLCFFLPSLISSIVMAFVFKSLVGTEGFIAQFIQKADKLPYVPELLADSRYALKTLYLQRILFGFAGNMLLWCGTMSRIPDSVIESARLDGVNWLQEAFLIIIPMILPTCAIMLCVSFSGIFGSSGGEFLLTGGDYGTMTYSTWLFMQVFGSATNSNSHNVAAAAGFLTTLISLPVVLITRSIANKINEGTEY